MQLETERFSIRPLTALDAAPHLCAWTLDPLGAEMLNQSQHVWAIEDQRRLFAAQANNPSQLRLGIWAKEINKLIGFFIVDLHPKNQAYTLTTLIGELSWRGQHVIGEAADVIHGHFFEKLGFLKAKANVRPHNKSMLWMMSHGGWRKEAHLIKHIRDNVNQTRVDVLAMGLLPKDWKEGVARRKRFALERQARQRDIGHAK
jgi:RimJ/RimL family protein N-acetyltransferase